MLWVRGIFAVLALGATAGAQLREVSPREADGKKVERIRFAHRAEKLIKNRDLRAAMRIQEGTPFRRRFFDYDLSTVRNLYHSKGYRDAQIARKTLSLDGKDRLHIAIEIDSGTLWTIKSLQVRGELPFAAEELRLQTGLSAGDPLDYGKVLDGERLLEIFLNKQGYPHVKVRNEWRDHRATHSADVVYHVEVGRRMYFGEIRIENEEQLRTRRRFVERYLSFEKGDLYDPEELVRTRNQLARTDLFRSVFLSTPPVAQGDTLQPIQVRLQEKKYLSLGANFFLNNTAPRLAGIVKHGNWLGRGAQLGLNASLGQPLQGATLFFTERDLLRTGANLTLSAGVTDEWSRTEVLGNPDDARQYDLLTQNDSVLQGLLIFAGEEVAREYINTVVYEYRSIERLWELAGTLSRSWQDIYQANFSINWTRARTVPDQSENIVYTPSDLAAEGGQGEAGEGDEGFDDLFGDEDFGFDDDFIPQENPGATPALDYSDGKIPVDELWDEILADRSRSVNFTAEFLRDSRDDRIAPTRGMLCRLTGLYAIKLGRRSTSVVDGEAEVRRYQRLSRHLVLALALQGTRTASLRQGRALPQVYWKQYGGEGSVRGVERNDIRAVGGGRTGLNLRTELRFQRGALGLVGFWDRANVWRHQKDIELKNMVDGYGVGLRYALGFPFRLDLAFNDGFDPKHPMRFYFSIGQAF
jgi:outer membrane protein assembly factor BamA